MADARGWLGPAVLIVLAVTAARLAALAFNRTDLWVDESQYWLWGQRLDLGYYSKPPLVAWVIRASTALGASDGAFWIRAPGAVLHGATALILAATAAALFPVRVAIWTAATYVTLPMVALGSLLISTDTVMAPFLATALFFFHRAATGRGLADAAGAGAMLGLAFLAKYAALYFLAGAALAALVPAWRLATRQWLVLMAAFLAVAAPNILWNVAHELTTVAHTMDNTGWARTGGGFAPAALAEFLGSQFAVVGPLVFAALIWAALRPGSADVRALTLFALPVIVIVSGQALVGGANANWGVAAYFAGTIAAVANLAARAPGLLPVSLIVNGLVALALPVLTLTVPWPLVEGRPLLHRYLGQSDLSRQIIAAAKEAGATAVYAGERAILADLLYTGRDSGLAIFAPSPDGRAHNYYEQTFPLVPGAEPLAVVAGAEPACDGQPATAIRSLDLSGSGLEGRTLRVYLVPGGCRDALP